MVLNGMLQKWIYIVVGEKPEELQHMPEDMPRALEQSPNKKSKSKRLRNAMFLYREQEEKKPWQTREDFQAFYDHKMEKFIAHYTEKLH